jgi:hypothetical protein
MEPVGRSGVQVTEKTKTLAIAVAAFAAALAALVAVCGIEATVDIGSIFLALSIGGYFLERWKGMS